LKKILLFFVFILGSIVVKAQGDYNFSPYGIGFGSSIIRGYTNVSRQNNTLAFNGNFNYYYTPYLVLSTEIQGGRLWGGSRVTDPSGREYENNYFALIVHGDLQLGEVINYDNSWILNILKNGYFGPGAGFVDDNVKNQRTNLIASQLYPVGTYVFPGKDHSINPVVALRAGYEVKFYNSYDEPYIRLYVEYEHNIVFGEGLDGYDDPPSEFKNNSPDQYRQITIGIKYNFGLIRSYTKPIRGRF
jgi:hypothetical protein